MKRITTTLARIVLALGALSMFAAFALPVNARDNRHRDWNHGHRHHRHDDHRARGHDHGPRFIGVDRFVVPRRIRSFELTGFRPYYRGVVFHSGHRHNHRVYAFPVRSRYGFVYRPHAYCDSRLFEETRFTYHGRHVGFTLRF